MYVLDGPRCAPREEISSSGHSAFKGDTVTTPRAPGPLLPVRYMAAPALAVERSIAASARRAPGARNRAGADLGAPISITCVPGELALWEAHLAGNAAHVSATAAAAFRASPESEGGAFALSFVSVLPASGSVPSGAGTSADDAVCRAPGCGAPAGERCAGCSGATYCSRACQRSDWPVHKRVCARRDKNAAAGAAAAPADSVQCATAAADGESVVVDLTSARGCIAGFSFKTGRQYAPQDVAEPGVDLSGGRRFVVKVQVSLEPGKPSLLYDKDRRVQAMTVSPPLAAAVRKYAVGGIPKAYLWAQREGDCVRVFTDRAAPTPEW